MTDEQIALARRAVACRAWRWMPGMLCVWPNGNEFRVGQVNGVDGVNELPNYPSGGYGDDYSDRTKGHPDLTDPATLGCVLALVREAWGDPTATTAATREADGSRGWLVDCWDTQSPLSGLGPFKSEAEALVAALEAAP